MCIRDSPWAERAGQALRGQRGEPARDHGPVSGADRAGPPGVTDAAASAGITAESKINDVLARHPATAPVFTQGRRLYVDQLHDLYARFPGLTVGDFARQNSLDLGAFSWTS